MGLMEYLLGLLADCPHVGIPAGEEDGGGLFHPEAELAGGVLKRYLNGDEQRHFFFTLTRPAVGNREENTAMCEEIAGWMRDKTRRRRLPPMGDGRQAMELSVLQGGCSQETAENETSGVYTIRCRLTYYEKARN